MSASWELQKALFQALTAHAPLVAAVTGVFDAPPSSQKLPYVLIGDDAVQDWSSNSFTGSEHRISVHIWTRSETLGEAKRIAALVQAALETAPTIATPWRIGLFRHLATRLLREPDGVTAHAVLEFRALITPVV
jgi:hypothetical protein